ncbi:gluconate 2-dehydrogenase subunit 3 family protein [Limnobaculum xujianqingii]|uniref:gluconate 2-dehydrogenase subunit 3 family protein n=1 Tax=Limnobaculum xujianqingii TaxID=2738837 RepID=UPI00112C6F30|nr:gluconate 2-dehydrogenase subunit 3 family protein [Limnobaculum xujianqingii]
MSDIKHSNSRRDFLRKGFGVIPVVAIASSGLVSNIAQADSPSPSSDYKPTFFNQAEWAFVLAACDLLIPEDQYGAGAIKACVPEFIDRQMDTPYGRGELWYMKGPFHPDAAPEFGYQLKLVPRDLYHLGISGCDKWCQQQYKKAFAELDKETQIAVLKQLEAGKIELGDVPAKTFFSYLLTNTKEGYFADPQYGGNRHLVGWKMVGFPGARADFMDWVEHSERPYPLGPVSISGERG